MTNTNVEKRKKTPKAGWSDGQFTPTDETKGGQCELGVRLKKKKVPVRPSRRSKAPHRLRFRIRLNSIWASQSQIVTEELLPQYHSTS